MQCKHYSTEITSIHILGGPTMLVKALALEITILSEEAFENMAG